MEDTWAGQSPDPRDARSGARFFDGLHLEPADDDPLGDEAAFPSTWQQLTPLDTPRD